MTQNIVAQFPVVSKADLLYGDSCAICHETYASEAPVRLPCGHEFGFECISTWLSPEGGRKTCPLCRHQLVAGTRTTSASEAEETRAIFENIVTAIELDIEITERGLTMRRSRSFREWLLYTELRSQGANLPPLPSDAGEIRTELGPSHEDALFRELQRRGAFLVLPIEVGPLVTVRAIWDWLRDNGYSWHPRHVANATDNCGWIRSQEVYSTTYGVDSLQ